MAHSKSETPKTAPEAASKAGTAKPERTWKVERVQTGVRMEKRMLKVLKGLAEYHDISLGDLLEGIVLHVFEGKAPFGETSLGVVAELRRVYGLELTTEAAHRLEE